MLYTFISYSSKNQSLADAMNKILKDNGISTWMAPGDIPIGEKYASVINQAIKGCTCLMLLLTNDAQNSKWVSKEIERAISYGKVIIPVKLEEVILNDEFEFYLSTDQLVSLPKIDSNCDEMKNIIRVLSTHLKIENNDNTVQNIGQKVEIDIEQQKHATVSSSFDNIDAAYRLICVIDTSGSMSGDRIRQVNIGLKELETYISGKYGNELAVDILSFNATPELNTFNDSPLQAGGTTNLGKALSSMVQYGKNIPKECMCGIIFITDGGSTDSYTNALHRLKDEYWFSMAIKTGIAIGDDASKEDLVNLTDSDASIVSLNANEIDSFPELFKNIAIATVKSTIKNSTQRTKIDGRNIIEWLNNENIDEKLNWIYRENGTLDISSGSIIMD